MASYRDRVPTDLQELKQRNLSVECPYCNADIIAEPVSTPISNDGYAYFVALCPHHRSAGRYCKPFFVRYQALNDCIVERYPLPNADWRNFHKAIPENIRKDYAEALQCNYASAYKGTVSLCRRVVEAICFDKLEQKVEKLREKKLWEMIDSLKIEGFVTESLRATAHEIRHLGNYGVHFQDDGLDEVSREEAKEIQGFAQELLNTVYITPFKTEEMRNKREGKK